MDKEREFWIAFAVELIIVVAGTIAAVHLHIGNICYRMCH